jgi:hypothetical protein
MAAGKGCSGARRYSGKRTRIPLARPSRAASSSASARNVCLGQIVGRVVQQNRHSRDHCSYAARVEQR